MYCTSCGKQIADNAVFCPYCGKPTPQGDELTGLVAAARIGDQDAIGTLYEKTYSKVYYTVKSMIKDEDAVFDIVQDTYIKAFAHLDSFQGDTKFLPWVRQIAANTARDWLKKKRPMLFTELSPGDELDTPVEELFPDERSENLPDQVIDQKETKRLIGEIIEELPEDQRAAIGMFYYEEMSVKEIAAAMGVSESAVKSRLMYGRNKIEKKVRELEKQGTKLYSLSPLPFLLLLFRNQKAYAAEVPDSRILRAILASRSMGAATAAGIAKGAVTTGAAASTEVTGTATAGGLGALKIGLIAFAAGAVVSLGAFVATRIASNSAEPQEASVIEEVIDSGESETSEMSVTIDQEESDHIDEALEQYRTIVSQADSYEYGDEYYFWEEVYRYALVQMQPDDQIPTLLLEKKELNTERALSTYYARVFQYDPDTKTVRQPTDIIPDDEMNVRLSMAGDGYGIINLVWSEIRGEGAATRITLDGDSLNWDNFWTGFEIPDSITYIEIEWHEIEDLSALDRWTVPDPIDEALEQYRIITGQADDYDYGEYAETNQPWQEFIGYRYALVQMKLDDPVPTLLLEWGMMDTETSVPSYYARVFQYDPDTKIVRQPTESIADGGIRGGLSMAGDGYGIYSVSWSGGTGEGFVYRYTLDGDSLNRDDDWTGNIFEMPDSITFIDIEWHEIEDLSALDSWTAPETSEAEPSDSDTLPTDGDRIVLTGTVRTCDYDEIVALQEQPDPNGNDENSVRIARTLTYRVIVLDTPQTLRLLNIDEDYRSHEASMICINDADGMDRYEGRHITFSIDPANTWWPSGADLPFGQPATSDIHILD